MIKKRRLPSSDRYDVDNDPDGPQAQVKTKSSNSGRPPEDEFSEPTENPTAYVYKVIREAKSGNLPIGRYPAILHSIRILEPNDRGTSIMATFVIAAPEYLGFRHNRFFRIAGPNREPDDWGPRFFNRMMTAMGYGEGNRGEKARQEICRQRPAVLLKLTAGNPGFVNTQVVRRFDSDTDDLEACRAWIADHMDAAQGAKP